MSEQHHHQVTKLPATLDEHEEEMTTFGYTVVDTKKVYIIASYRILVLLL